MDNTRTRDLVGYGRHRPHAGWPGAARVAVSFVLNYEEGGERNVMDGVRTRKPISPRTW